MAAAVALRSDADIAAAHANISEFHDALVFSREAISIICGKVEFAETEANAYMTAANSLAMTGSFLEADNYYDKARAIYETLPGNVGYLKALERNRATVGRIGPENNKPWWKRW